MDYIKGADREQIILFPEAIDDYIGEDNPARFVDAFVSSLDLSGLEFKYSEVKSTGRPPYDPADMLKLYIYGYLNRIRSSRRLEKEAERNVELMWLLKKLVPDHKTIANFRKDNPDPLRKTFREFTLVCKRLDLFGTELIAVDGSKFRAQNAKKKSFNKDKLNRTIKAIDEKIAGYMSELKKNDEIESRDKVSSTQELKEKIRLRQWLSEHPFGTLKRGFDQGYLLLKRLNKVRGEFSLSVLAYNMKRAINIVGIRGLIDAVMAASSYSCRQNYGTRPAGLTCQRFGWFGFYTV